MSKAYLALVVAGICMAQNPDGPKFYKLDFVVKELDAGKLVNARSYSTMISTEKGSGPCSIRSGTRVPINTSSGGQAQVTYAEVGVNIDCRAATEVGTGELALTLTADISSNAQESTGSLPVIRNRKWSASVRVPLRKPVVVFSGDDTSGKGQMQLELTATPLR